MMKNLVLLRYTRLILQINYAELTKDNKLAVAVCDTWAYILFIKHTTTYNNLYLISLLFCIFNCLWLYIVTVKSIVYYLYGFVCLCCY